MHPPARRHAHDAFTPFARMLRFTQPLHRCPARTLACSPARPCILTGSAQWRQRAARVRRPSRTENSSALNPQKTPPTCRRRAGGGHEAYALEEDGMGCVILVDVFLDLRLADDAAHPTRRSLVCERVRARMIMCARVCGRACECARASGGYQLQGALCMYKCSPLQDFYRPRLHRCVGGRVQRNHFEQLDLPQPQPRCA
jgi:hypothetical protein